MKIKSLTQRKKKVQELPTSHFKKLNRPKNKSLTNIRCNTKNIERE